MTNSFSSMFILQEFFLPYPLPNYFSNGLSLSWFLLHPFLSFAPRTSCFPYLQFHLIPLPPTSPTFVSFLPICLISHLFPNHFSYFFLSLLIFSPISPINYYYFHSPPVSQPYNCHTCSKKFGQARPDEWKIPWESWGKRVHMIVWNNRTKLGVFCFLSCQRWHRYQPITKCR